MGCVFCSIAAGQRPAGVVFENDRVIIFTDHRPQAKIHLLVCPKAHYPTFMDAPGEEIEYLFKICRNLAETLSVEDGFRMVINNGPQGGQIVFHLHVHFLSWLKDMPPGKIELTVK